MRAFGERLLSLLLLMLFLTNIAWDAGEPLMTKTISAKEKGGEGRLAIVPTSLLEEVGGCNAV